MRLRRLAPVVLGFSGLLAACGSSSDGWDPSSADAQARADAAAVSCPTAGEEWEVAKVYIEHNATDEYSVDDLKADFPEGSYVIAGVGVDRRRPDR